MVSRRRGGRSAHSGFYWKRRRRRLLHHRLLRLHPRACVNECAGSRYGTRRAFPPPAKWRRQWEIREEGLRAAEYTNIFRNVYACREGVVRINLPVVDLALTGRKPLRKITVGFDRPCRQPNTRKFFENFAAELCCTFRFWTAVNFLDDTAVVSVGEKLKTPAVVPGTRCLFFISPTTYTHRVRVLLLLDYCFSPPVAVVR